MRHLENQKEHIRPVKTETFVTKAYHMWIKEAKKKRNLEFQN